MHYPSNSAQWSFKSATSSSNVNCASCQSDKNLSGALAHIWQSFWLEPGVDFITPVAVAAATLIPPHPRGKGLRGHTEFGVKQAGLTPCWGLVGYGGAGASLHWLISVCNAVLPEHTHAPWTWAWTHTQMHILSALLVLGWYNDPTEGSLRIKEENNNRQWSSALPLVKFMEFALLSQHPGWGARIKSSWIYKHW